MRSALYYILRTLLQPLRYRVRGLEHILGTGPALYIGNHAENMGPLQAVLTLPVRLHPWVIAEMLDWRRIVPYVQARFTEPVWHWRGVWGLMGARFAAGLTGHTLRGIGSIPVDRTNQHYLTAFRLSLEALMRGRNLLIFPEAPDGPRDPVTHLRAFLPGFMQVCALYHRRTGRQLPVYPLAVVRERRMVLLGAPLMLCQGVDGRDELNILRDTLQEVVGRLIVEVLGSPG